jgi:hypothetical protein
MKTFLALIFFSVNLIAQYGQWTEAAYLNHARYSHAAVLLDDGRVLVAGGREVADPIADAEIYNPSLNKWIETTPMPFARSGHQLVNLSNNNILSIHRDGCDLFNVTTETWSVQNHFHVVRSNLPDAVRIDSGNVLLVGGRFYRSYTDYDVLPDCEIFNRNTHEWDIVSRMNFSRYQHTVTKLNNGRVLVTGGRTSKEDSTVTNSCEIYDPINDKWDVVGSMNYNRENHRALLLPDGRVFVAGGANSCEIFDPATLNWKMAYNSRFGYDSQKLVMLNDSLIISAGGSDDGFDIFNLQINQIVYHATLYEGLYDPGILKMDENKILCIGGQQEMGIGIYYSFRCFLYDYVVGIKELDNRTPTNFSLSQNYPNPFNPSTVIKYALPVTSNIKLTIYNTMGQEIKTFESVGLSQGTHQFTWNGTNKNNEPVASSIYIYRLRAVGQNSKVFEKSAKMLLLK